MNRLLLVAAVVLAACGPKGPSAITPTLPGEGDDHVAKPGAPAPAKSNDPWAGRTDLIEPPAPKPAQKLELPPIQRFELPNGLEVFVVVSDRLPVMSMQLAVKAGRADEQRDKLGVATFTGNMLLKGTRQRNAMTIATQIDDVGGQIASDTSYEATLITCNVMAKDSGTCIGLVSDVVSAPSFPGDEMPKVREELMGEVRQRLDDAGVMAGAQVQNLLWGNEHVRGWAVTADGLASITRDDLVAWHRDHVSPDNAILAVVGAVDPAALKRDLTRAFAGWKRRKTSPRPTYAEPKLDGVRVRLVDKPRQTQTHIRIGQLGIRHDDPRFFETLVWNHVLGGGGFASRLVKVVRSEGGKTYAVSSSFDRNLDRGSFVISTFTRNAEAVATTKLLIDEVARMQKTGPTQDEVAAAIANLAGSYAVRYESVGAVASALLAAELHGFGEEYLESYALAVGKVDVDDARQAAQEILTPSDFVIVMVGDARELEPQLKKAGWRYQKVSYLDPIGGTAPAPVAADPKAEAAARKILEDALVAKGGAARLSALKTLTLVAKGRLTSQNRTVEVDITRRMVLPDKTRVDLVLTANHVTISYGFDGKDAWQQSPQGVAEIPADQLPVLDRQRWGDADLILLRHREKGAKVQALPDETVDGTAYHVVRVGSADGKHAAVLYIDKKTKLLGRVASPDPAGATVEIYADYRAVGGLQIAHKRESRGAAEAASLEYSKVELDTPIDAAVFARPAAAAPGGSR